MGLKFYTIKTFVVVFKLDSRFSLYNRNLIRYVKYLYNLQSITKNPGNSSQSHSCLPRSRLTSYNQRGMLEILKYVERKEYYGRN